MCTNISHIVYKKLCCKYNLHTPRSTRSANCIMTVLTQWVVLTNEVRQSNIVIENNIKWQWIYFLTRYHQLGDIKPLEVEHKTVRITIVTIWNILAKQSKFPEMYLTNILTAASFSSSPSFILWLRVSHVLFTNIKLPSCCLINVSAKIITINSL